MAFVPGRDQDDVFISYSWQDNANEWVTHLTNALRARMRELLGEEPSIWRDEDRLGKAQNFTTEIEARLDKTAVLVLVLGPGYFQSGFCGLELKHFEKKLERERLEARAKDSPSGSTRSRIIKVVKLPDIEELHRTVLEEQLGFSFYRGDSFENAFEHQLGEGVFNTELDRLAKSLCAILREIRNERTPVYVSQPGPPDALLGWTRLRSELKSHGFYVLPSFRLAGSPNPSQLQKLQKEMEPVAVSVHMLSAAWSEFSKVQIDLALQMARTTIVWMSPDATPDSLQKQYLETLNGHKHLKILREPDWKLPGIVSEEAKPKPAALPAAPKGRRKVYLLCDRTDTADEREALRLSGAISQRENLEVILPPKSQDYKVMVDHQQQCLSECDGVLVLWGNAGKRWFIFHYGNLQMMESARRRKGTPICSFRVAMPRPEMDPDLPGLEQWAMAYPSPEDLEPFLAPLRPKAPANGDA